MRLIDFTAEHIGRAAEIAIQSYSIERSFVPLLPHIEAVPDLTSFAEYGMGVAAIDNGKMLGFLCAYPPFENAFRSTNAVGVFSPMGANGAIGENRALVYARLYEAAGAKWVKAGASSHAVCLYAHDREAQEQFFRYGFGMRCVDGIRMMDEINEPMPDEYTTDEITTDGCAEIYPLLVGLTDGYHESPFFMNRGTFSEEEYIQDYIKNNPQCLIIRHKNKAVAFLMAEPGGETFIGDTKNYLHISGAYCLPEHRGKGLMQKLLSKMTKRLKGQGYTRLGVDYESINPSGSRFWAKHFSAYTCGVVRRIDERVLS